MENNNCLVNQELEEFLTHVANIYGIELSNSPKEVKKPVTGAGAVIKIGSLKLKPFSDGDFK